MVQYSIVDYSIALYQYILVVQSSIQEYIVYSRKQEYIVVYRSIQEYIVVYSRYSSIQWYIVVHSYSSIQQYMVQQFIVANSNVTQLYYNIVITQLQHTYISSEDFPSHRYTRHHELELPGSFGELWREPRNMPRKFPWFFKSELSSLFLLPPFSQTDGMALQQHHFCEPWPKATSPPRPVQDFRAFRGHVTSHETRPVKLYFVFPPARPAR